MTKDTQNNIDSDFVPYEQALEIEKLGYILGAFIKCYGRTDKKLYWTEFDVDSESPSEYHKFIPAYTYRQAFRWFMKEHGLYSSIVPKKSTPDNFVSGVEWYVWIWGGNGKDLGPKDIYSYSEAEIACLNRLIELGREDKQAKVIRAKIPADYDQRIHVVTKFKRDNYSSFYKLQEDGFYRYQEHSAERSISYTEGALLALSNVEVVEFKNK